MARGAGDKAEGAAKAFPTPWCLRRSIGTNIVAIRCHKTPFASSKLTLDLTSLTLYQSL